MVNFEIWKKTLTEVLMPEKVVWDWQKVNEIGVLIDLAWDT